MIQETKEKFNKYKLLITGQPKKTGIIVIYVILVVLIMGSGIYWWQGLIYKELLHITSTEEQKGKKISNVDLSEINIKDLISLGGGYFKDEKYIYKKSGDDGAYIIKEADLNSFEVIGDWFTKDNNNVYYQGRKLEDADPKTFQYSPDSIFQKDKNNVYIYNNFWGMWLIKGADPETIEDMGIRRDTFYRDKNHVFAYGEHGVVMLEGSNPDSFQEMRNVGSESYILYIIGIKIRFIGQEKVIDIGILPAYS